MADVGDEFRPGRRYAVSAAALVLLLALEREQNPAQQRRPLERGDVGRSLLEVEGGGVQAEHRRHLCARDPPPTDVLVAKAVRIFEQQDFGEGRGDSEFTAEHDLGRRLSSRTGNEAGGKAL